MAVKVRGKNIEVTQALKDYVENVSRPSPNNSRRLARSLP